MINVTVKSNDVRENRIVSLSDTPLSVLESVGVPTGHVMPWMRGEQLSGEELLMTFEELGVEDGTDVKISAVVKADGAADR